MYFRNHDGSRPVIYWRITVKSGIILFVRKMYFLVPITYVLYLDLLKIGDIVANMQDDFTI